MSVSITVDGYWLHDDRNRARGLTERLFASWEALLHHSMCQSQSRRDRRAILFPFVLEMLEIIVDNTRESPFPEVHDDKELCCCQLNTRVWKSICISLLRRSRKDVREKVDVLLTVYLTAFLLKSFHLMIYCVASFSLRTSSSLLSLTLNWRSGHASCRHCSLELSMSYTLVVLQPQGMSWVIISIMNETWW